MNTPYAGSNNPLDAVLRRDLNALRTLDGEFMQVKQRLQQQCLKGLPPDEFKAAESLREALDIGSLILKRQQEKLNN